MFLKIIDKQLFGSRYMFFALVFMEQFITFIQKIALFGLKSNFFPRQLEAFQFRVEYLF